jgi:hypothetical protein
MSNEQLRKYVNLIDNGPQKRKRSINESAGARIKYKRVQTLTEAQRLVQLIENSELTEEQLDELVGGLGALAGAVGRKVAGAAGAVGRGVQGAAGVLGRGVQGAAGAAGQAVKAVSAKVGQTYAAGEQAAAQRKEEEARKKQQAQITSMGTQLLRDLSPEDQQMLIGILQSKATNESRRYRKKK